jgi:hypothetical protein
MICDFCKKLGWFEGVEDMVGVVMGEFGVV